MATSAPHWDRTEGDVHDSLVVQLGGLGPTGLGPVTALEGHVWRTTSTDPATVLVATVTDATAGTVTVSLDGWLNSISIANGAVEVWQFELQITSATVGPITWPEGRKGTINVWAQGA